MACASPKVGENGHKATAALGAVGADGFSVTVNAAGSSTLKFQI